MSFTHQMDFYDWVSNHKGLITLSISFQSPDVHVMLSTHSSRPRPSRHVVESYLSEGLSVGAHVSQDDQHVLLTLVSQVLC